MAPLIKKKHPIRTRVTKSARDVHTSHNSTHSASEIFRSSKEDKRRMKHSTLISRIEKTNTKATKRRRPSKKLIANLESLVDALPVIDEAEGDETVVGEVRVRHRSLKSRPGAMKKKEKLEKMEKERFSRNMAQMALGEVSGSNVADAGIASTSQENSKRWAALRSHIQQSMDPIRKAA
ncbi:MAG: hypothetical protein Q9187_006739 [Circinaria calcarea]